MNKLVFGVIAIVIVALAGGVFLASDSDDDTASQTTQQTGAMSDTVADNTSGDEQEIELQSSGENGIQEYSPEALANSETEDNVLFFHAQWCSVCKSVERNIMAGSIPDNLSIFLVDYDSPEGRDLASQYEIPIQYSMVQVDTEGNEINQWVNNFNVGIDEVVGQLI